MDPVYPPEMKIKDALQVYFKAHGFNEGGYNDKFFYIVLGPLRIPVPNTKKRLMAVKFHDIHHVLTGYNARWKSEIQIGGWELASGCGKFLVAWVLNFGSFGVGLLLFPRRLYKAFMRGRRTKSNLYYSHSYDNALLEQTIGDLRNEVKVDGNIKNTAVDSLLFGMWSTFVTLELALIISAFCIVFDLIIH